MPRLQIVDGGKRNIGRCAPGTSCLRPLARRVGRAAGLRPFVFAILFTAAAPVFAAHPVRTGALPAGVMVFLCSLAAWATTLALGRASPLFGAAVLAGCGACLLYLPEPAYAPLTPVLLQGHVIAATLALIVSAFTPHVPRPELNPAVHRS